MIKYYLKNEEWDLKRATDGASGYDLRADIGVEREIKPGQRWLISTGLFLEMPRGVAALVCTRSGLAINHGVIVLNAPGVVDSDYRGEVKVSLINLSDTPYNLVPGERVAQLLFVSTFIDREMNGDRWMSAGSESAGSLLRLDSQSMLTDSTRGSGGHGSTGR